MEPNDWQAIVAKPYKKDYMTEQVVERVRQDPRLDELLALALGEGSEAFRASRCVEIVYEWDRVLFLEYKNRFVSDLSKAVHYGVRRIYAHMMWFMLKRGEYDPTQEEAEQLARTICAWCIEPGVKVSALVWYLSLLNWFSGRVEWAGDMLWQIVELNDLDRSPGMRALLRRMRKSFKIA